MRSLPLIRLLLSSALFLALSLGAWASVSKRETLGDNTYAITRIATSGFDRDVAKFRQEAEQDAAAFCASQDKVLKIVSVSTDRPHFGGGFASARIVFKALSPGEAALAAAEPAVAPAAPGAVPAPAVAAPASTLPTYAGDLYTEILKLDDLRKRGLLSDKEFEQQKKKLLKKSK